MIRAGTIGPGTGEGKTRKYGGTVTPNKAAKVWAAACPDEMMREIGTETTLRALREQYVRLFGKPVDKLRRGLHSAIRLVRLARRAPEVPAVLGLPTATVASELASIAVDEDGLSVLAWAHARLPRTIAGRRPVNVASMPRLHRASADEAMMLPGFVTTSNQVNLPEPFTAGVPSWVLSLFDQGGGGGSQRGRKGAPWSMRLWVYSVLNVEIDERDGRTVLLPLRLEDIERWIWPQGWDRSNRRKYWPRFRAQLLGLGAIRPRIIGPDGRAYLLEVVRVPLVPEEWDRAAACPIFVSIPRAAAAGAALDWPALRGYGTESPGLFRAYLSTAAVLDYTAHNGHGITATIAPPVVTSDGRRVRESYTDPRGRRRSRVKRDYRAKAVENPAARYVGRLTDEDLRRMMGLPNHPEYRRRARRYMERLHADGVVDLRREPDGRVRLFQPRTGG